MKKSLFVVAGLAAFANLAHAQTSSVTMFGVIDVGVRRVENNDVTLWKESTSGLRSSRFGVRGVEALGGDLSAGFHLEGGLSADAGTADATRFWGRRSTVSLISKSLGEIRLGRDLTPIWTGFADYDTFNTNGVADAGKFDSVLGSGAVTATRSDNMVSYITPGTLGGAFVRLSGAPSEGAGGTKFFGGEAGYIGGPLSVSLSYGETNDAANAEKWKKASLGASYNFGPVIVLGYLTENKYINQKLDIAQIGVKVPVGAHTFRVNYTKADAKGNSNAIGVAATPANSVDANDADQVAVGYIYTASKRTSLYGTYALVKNEGAARYLVDATPALAAGAAGNGKKSSGIELGVMHAF